MKRTVIYSRVSTDKQEAENQLHELRRYCNSSNDIELIEEYVDVMSGGKESRPMFDRMFRDAYQRKFDHVVFWDLSRFSRAGIEHTFRKLGELDKLGVSWYSYTEPMLDTTNELVRDIVTAVMAAVNKAERQRISARTKAALERLKSHGKKLGRPRGSKDKKRRRNAGYFGNKNQQIKGTPKNGVKTNTRGVV